jgi:peptide/nickel transport system permease protein
MFRLTLILILIVLIAARWWVGSHPNKFILRILQCVDWIGWIILSVAAIYFFITFVRLNKLQTTGLFFLVLQDLLVIAAVAGAGWGIVRFTRSERWQRALGRFYRDWIGLASLAVIALYFFVGVTDILKMPVKSDSGQPPSLLDIFFHRVRREKNYSAPFAQTTYSANRAQPLQGKHVLGTDQLGKDVLLQTMKGCSTAILIGTLTSLIYIPIGICLGIAAGYYKKRVDDFVQYSYSTLASIPGILLLVALLLILGKGVWQISFALGITGWIGLCRLLRGETLRQSEKPYCEAARALGQSDINIIFRHILPNVMHLVFINFVLGFSGIVLAESILSYLGVGMPIGTASWGVMIDSARMELSRDPMVWWNIGAATFALFFLVLSLNLLGDSLRRAFDPKSV